MKQVLTLLLTTSLIFPYAQSVVISENESTSDASSILDVQSTAKGVLLPRLTETQRISILSPATGLLVFQTDNADGFYFYNGSSWLHLIDGLEEDPQFSTSPANAITDAGSGKIITSNERDSIELAFSTPRLFVADNTDSGTRTTFEEYVDSGLQAVVPEDGTYLVNYNGTALFTGATLTLKIRLYNVTTSTQLQEVWGSTSLAYSSAFGTGIFTLNEGDILRVDHFILGSTGSWISVGRAAITMIRTNP